MRLPRRKKSPRRSRSRRSPRRPRSNDLALFKSFNNQGKHNSTPSNATYHPFIIQPSSFRSIIRLADGWLIKFRMVQQGQCFKCGNSHVGGCSTEAVYFYWCPETHDNQHEVFIIGDWTKWQKKQKMNRNELKNGDRYFSILLALTQGRHEYKFIVDGQWRHDSCSPATPNEYGNFNNVVQILPKKTYIQRHKDCNVRISSNICVENLKITGSWDQWSTETPMTKTFNPLKGCNEKQGRVLCSIIDLDLQVDKTYEFKFKHGSQYLIDEKYPTVMNTFGTMNNFIIVYEKFISVETPNTKNAPLLGKKVSSMSQKSQHTNGRAFKWKKVNCSLQLPYQRVQGHTMCSVGEYIYIFGGKSRNQFYNSLLKIDSKFEKVQFEQLVPDGRAFHIMKVYGNKILIYGGNNNMVLEDYHTFNVSERKWQTSPIIPTICEKKLQKQSCVLYESLLVFFGGYHCEKEEECSVEALSHDLRVLDLQKMQWIDNIKVQSLHPQGRFGHTAAIIQSTMYIFAGISDPLSGHNLNDLWMMNLQNVRSLTWEKIKAAGKAPLPRHGHSMNAINNLLVIYGGQTEDNLFLNQLIVYHTMLNEWIYPIIQGIIPKPRSNHASTNFNNDQIAIFGGKTPENSKNKSFYILKAVDNDNSTLSFSDSDEDD